MTQEEFSESCSKVGRCRALYATSPPKGVASFAHRLEPQGGDLKFQFLTIDSMEVGLRLPKETANKGEWGLFEFEGILAAA